MARRSTQTALTDELPQLLAERDMSLRDLAAVADVSPGHLSRVLRRKNYKTVSGELAGRIAVALDLPQDYFPEFRESQLVERIRTDAGLRDRLYRRYGHD